MTVWMCSRIGQPVDRPWIVAVQVQTERDVRLIDGAAPLRAAVERHVARIPELCRELVEGRHRVC